MIGQLSITTSGRVADKVQICINELIDKWQKEQEAESLQASDIDL